MEATVLTRKFIFNNKNLDDPNKNWTIEEVRNHLSNIYPELVVANIAEPKITSDSIIYEFKSNIGTKG